MTPELIYDDPHVIREIRFADGRRYQTGTETQEIVAYKEMGIGDFTAFYAVYGFYGKIIARVPAHMVEVIYSERLKP